MKKFLTICAVAAFAAAMTTSFGQGAGPKNGGQGGQGKPGQGQGDRQGMSQADREAMVKKMTEAKTKILTSLKLSKDQMTKLKAADDKQEAVTKKLRDARKPGQQMDQAQRQKAMDTMREARKTHEETYKKVMGEATYKKYQEAWQKWIKENGFQRGPGAGRGGDAGKAGAGKAGAGTGKAGGGGKKPPTF
ncbi:MAG: hypothetical protein KF784_08645 [Fimbriimonadaceae bacterium]|nr:hypothetical protein [Fimbriimonadaceae bacterium]